VTDIAVAISTRDRPDALARCLESLQAGRVQPKEIVVADQSDTPSATEPARRIAARPGGLAAAQNDAVRATTAPVVAVLDDDCVADPGWIEALEHAFSAHPDMALVGGRVLPLGASGDRAFAVASRTSPTRREFSRPAAPWNVGSGNNFAVRREWFERVGGCDERLGPGTPGRGGLDMDLFYRILRDGGRALYEPGAVIHHEPATRAGRLERRRPYGYGMGAACGLRLREGDRRALLLLAGWVGLRVRVLGSALLSARWDALREEALVLSGTGAGLAHGLREDRSDGRS
jgi:GT2 family glycosyltransferase